MSSSQGAKNQLPFYFRTWFLIILFILTVFIAGIPAIVLSVVRIKKYPETAKKTWPVWALLVVFILIRVWSAASPDDQETNKVASNGEISTANSSNQGISNTDTNEIENRDVLASDNGASGEGDAEGSTETSNEVNDLIDPDWFPSTTGPDTMNMSDIEYGFKLLDDQIKKIDVDNAYSGYMDKVHTIFDGHKNDTVTYLKETKKTFKSPYFEMTQYDENAYYLGEIKNNKPSGEGILFDYDFGSDSDLPYIYVGEFKNGVFDGIGFELNEFGNGEFSFSIGEYKNGVANGLLLTYQYGNRDGNPSQHENYTDQLTDTEYSKGVEKGQRKTYIDGILIDDVSVKDGKFNGKGKIYYSNGQLYYEGHFKDGAFDGKGTMYNEDGSVKYSGQFKAGDYSS